MTLSDPFTAPASTTGPTAASTDRPLLLPTAAVLADVRDDLDTLEGCTPRQLAPYLDDLAEAAALLRNVTERVTTGGSR